MSANLAPTSYDLVPYESHPFPQTHPDRLATIATLLGLRPTAINRCRVLELGCAAGGNLIPMALGLPESTFIGVDLSKVQVDEGLEMVGALGLTNIQLKQQSILDVEPALGKFDYIICHGVYSWVPDHVQDKILNICKDNLAANGVAYVSYNTYPGWHMRGMIRDMLKYHAKQFIEPAMRVKQARNLLDFLVKSVTPEDSPYSRLLTGEVEGFRRSSDSYLFHEHLEDVNEPIYFFQFAERAAARGLKYLAEVDLRVMVPGNFPAEVSNVLHMLSYDLIHLEQYMDFLRNRMFRQTLLCHKNVQANYALRGEQLAAFHVASPAKPARAPADGASQGQGDLRSVVSAGSESRAERGAVRGDLRSGVSAGSETRAERGENRAERDGHAEVAVIQPALAVIGAEEMKFETPDGITLTLKEPLIKAAMVFLSERWPEATPFGQVVDEARRRVRAEGADDRSSRDADVQALGQALLTFYASASTSLAELSLHPVRFSVKVSERPRASLLARRQAETRPRVTNLRHETVFLGEFERQVLRHLDGQRDRADLRVVLAEQVAAGDLTVEKDGQPVQDQGQVQELLAEALEKQLPVFARNSLLVS